MNMLEVEPAPAASLQPDIPALREQLATLDSTGRAKEAIGVAMSQDQVKRLDPKDVEKYYKRYETYVGAKTTETVVNRFVSLYVRAVGAFVPIKDAEGLQNALKKD